MGELDFILLLHKRFAAEITADESAALDAWIAQAPDNARLAEQYHRIWFEATEQRPVDFQLDMDAEFRRLLAGIETAERRTPAKRVSIGRTWWRAAAAIAVLCMALWGYRQFTAPEPSVIVENILEDGGNRFVTLPDGSKVWLRHNATIVYPERFSTRERRVQLSGEAFFDVSHRANQPFRIGLDQGGLIEVLGTQFNVRAVAGADETCVLVRSGKVRYTPMEKGKSTVLTANHRAAFSRKNAQLSLTKVPTLNELAWQTGRLEFDSTPLRHVLSDLEKHFGTSIEVQNRKILDCVYSNTLTDQTLEEVLESFSLIYRLRVSQPAPGRYRLEGGHCN